MICTICNHCPILAFEYNKGFCGLGYTIIRTHEKIENNWYDHYHSDNCKLIEIKTNDDKSFTAETKVI